MKQNNATIRFASAVVGLVIAIGVFVFALTSVLEPEGEAGSGHGAASEGHGGDHDAGQHSLNTPATGGHGADGHGTEKKAADDHGAGSHTGSDATPPAPAAH